jgi:hypothetical protein
MRNCNQTENYGYYCSENCLDQTSVGPDFVIGLYWTLRLYLMVGLLKILEMSP